MIIKKVISKLFGLFFCALDYVWKKQDINIFGAGRGSRYFDNSKTLFEYYISQGDRAYWFYTGKKPDVVGISPDAFVQANSLYGMLIALRAKKAFACYGSLDFWLYRFSRKTVSVQLWHGIPIKKVFFGEKNLTQRKKLQYLFEISAFQYFIVSSKLEQYIISAQTGMHLDRVKVLGYPRNDNLFKSANEVIIPEVVALNSNFKKVVLFAPTFRNNDYSVFSSFNDDEWNVFFDFLKTENFLCIFRAHAVEFLQNNDDNAKRLSKYSSNVIFLGQDKYQDAQDLMVYSDILISDYSGMIPDYLLLDKPIIRFIFDEQQYDNERGVNFLQKNLPIGSAAYNMPTLIEALRQCVESTEESVAVNAFAKKMYHDNLCGKYSEKIYNYFNSLSQGKV
ncbi:TPA: CDP-glycerol glycerophosphotransferase family protein [Escherichia coli]|uniref:Glycerol phosphotransferase n=5 Tax=Escherichia coli TaxID=562 RepID=A4K7Z6_ECOLX|nr:CDP-glycerol glycerophosphotransferase family protein [Escherichia coli]EFP8476168.1 CDP-glycerol glycerophosphotransferase family protein [Shigella boydii]EHD3373200.1 CDP-glycerol glycerophosphotransferase family protein [Escherichia coli O124]EHD3469087.1 CDP-glycerol glycerophosphotransferase family protein [Escherichia coli O28ac]EHY2150113.1 CDP-glycerol glycerophosphotransferase family protein [Escherichia coli O157]EKG8122007.1 CDP-glycerol glycerophosphotransferase family protein [